MATSSAPFQQGEPLNIDALNALWNDARSASASINALTTTTSGITGSLSSGIPVFDADRIDFGVLGKAVNVNKTISFSKIDPTRDTNLTVIASLASTLNNTGDICTVSAKGSGSTWTIYVTTGPSWSGQVVVNWIALAYRTI